MFLRGTCEGRFHARACGRVVVLRVIHHRVCVVKSVLAGRTRAKGDFYLSSIAPAELVELSMTCRRLAALLSF